MVSQRRGGEGAAGPGKGSSGSMPTPPAARAPDTDGIHGTLVGPMINMFCPKLLLGPLFGNLSDKDQEVAATENVPHELAEQVRKREADLDNTGFIGRALVLSATFQGFTRITRKLPQFEPGDAAAEVIFATEAPKLHLQLQEHMNWLDSYAAVGGVVKKNLTPVFIGHVFLAAARRPSNCLMNPNLSQRSYRPCFLSRRKARSWKGLPRSTAAFPFRLKPRSTPNTNAWEGLL